MDALTHAIEGYTTLGAWELTDALHLKAIKIIATSLPGWRAATTQPGSGWGGTLAADLGALGSRREIGASEDDIPTLAAAAMSDVYAGGNPP